MDYAKIGSQRLYGLLNMDFAKIDETIRSAKAFDVVMPKIWQRFAGTSDLVSFQKCNFGTAVQEVAVKDWTVFGSLQRHRFLCKTKVSYREHPKL